MNNRTLQNNLKVLNEVCPSICDDIKNSEDKDWITHIKSKKVNNLLIKSTKGLNPVYDINESKKLQKEIAKNLSLSRREVTVVIGAGLGYLTKAILNKMDKDHHVVLIEPISQMIKYTLSNYNLTKQLQQGELIICKDKESTAFVLGLLETKGTIEQWNLLVESYANVRVLEYSDLITYVEGIINQIRCNTGTVISNGATMAENDIKNLPYVIRHRGVNELKDLFKGKPAITVSTGPSLVKNIHYLKHNQDKVIIIAVAQALRLLLAYDIIPDVICTVDFGEVNLDHFRGVMDCTVPLVCVNRTYAPILKSWQGPKFIISTPVPGYEETAIGLLNDKGAIDQGGSVSHCCFALAHHMGCSPITLIGQDLALSDGKSHIAQVDSGGEVSVDENNLIQWKIKDPRSSLKKGEVDTHSMGPVIMAPGYFNANVPTNIGLFSFITAFENLARVYSTDTKLYNSTCGGANIVGMERITLPSYLNQFCIESIDKTVLAPLLTLCSDANVKISSALNRLKKDIEVVEECFKESSKGLISNTLVEENLNTNDTKKLKQFIIDVEKPSLAACKAAYKNPLTKLAVFEASKTIENKHYNEKAENTLMIYLIANKDELKMRIERNKIILTAAKDQSNNLLRAYRQALHLLEKYELTQDESVLCTQEIEEVNLDDADTYFANGNWAHPLVDTRRVSQSDKNFLPLRFKPTYELIEKAKEVQIKAIQMRESIIKDSKKKYKESDLQKEIKYITLIEDSRKLITDQLKANEKEIQFKKAEEMIEEAYHLFPDRFEGKWGYATNLMQHKKYADSIKMYRELVTDFPDMIRLQFELGQVLLLDNQFEDGMKVISSVMEKTKEYDSFLYRVGELYFKAEMYEEALLTFNTYLDKFSADSRAINYKIKCLEKVGINEEVEACQKQLKNLGR